jgi:hypothetical protein
MAGSRSRSPSAPPRWPISTGLGQGGWRDALIRQEKQAPQDEDYAAVATGLYRLLLAELLDLQVRALCADLLPMRSMSGAIMPRPMRGPSGGSAGSISTI